MKLVAATKQLTSLRQLLASLGGERSAIASLVAPQSSAKLGRNMIVRGALQELSNSQTLAQRPQVLS